MQTLTYTFVDKSKWGAGPWQDEPDKVQFPDPKTGLPCLAVRTASLGHWCGYVGVADGHPAFEKDYSDVDVDVHGGLTFSSFCRHEPNEHGVCHVPEPGEQDSVWWLGFDCAHFGDAQPGMIADLATLGVRGGNAVLDYRRHDTYRTLEYVKAECANLARQLSDY